ncbi:MAG: ABC transporter permease [Gorillibacterium sp.]|nr:ABC transporter permease [Gorillibacterium sp.]
MRTFSQLFLAEWIKLRKSSIWLLIFVSPLLSAVLESIESLGKVDPELKWLYIIGDMVSLHGIFFLPLLAGVFAAFVCRYEHESGGWKQLLALPVRRTTVYLVKFSVVLLLIMGTQLIFLAAMLSVGAAQGVSATIPWEVLLRSTFGGFIATLPLVALQLAISVGWTSFAAPLAINVILTIPNVLIINSADYGPYYPWAQPYLAMMPGMKNSYRALNVSFETLMWVIVGGFLLFFFSGLTYFNRKEI